MMLLQHLILCHLLPLCLQSFLASGSFPKSQLFTSDGQTIEALASSSVLPANIQGWFPLGLTGLNSLLSKRHSRFFSSTTIWKHQFFSTQPSLWSNSHIHTWLPEKPYLWLYGPLLAKWCLLPKKYEGWVASGETMAKKYPGHHMESLQFKCSISSWRWNWSVSSHMGVDTILGSRNPSPGVGIWQLDRAKPNHHGRQDG